jgi:glycerate 2-kinase
VIRIVLAPDKFKGSLAAGDVAAALATGIHRRRPDVAVICRPVADGGEGTLDAFTAAGFTEVLTYATGAWGPKRHGTRFVVRSGTAVVELAATVGTASGGSPLTASTAGVGEVIRHALDLGCARIVLAVGGSVSTDGGIGMAQALGAVLRDRCGNALQINEIDKAAALDLTAFDTRVSSTEFVLAADVTNPLLGSHGAAHVFGPQKGATPAQVDALEHRMHFWSRLVAATIGTDRSRLPAAGAAGGVGFSALTLLDANFRCGIDVVREMVQLDAAISGATLVVTGEGCLDSQSLCGKAPIGVAEAARAHRVPAVAVAGMVRLDTAAATRAGFVATYALTDLEPDPPKAISHAAGLLQMIGDRIAEVHCGSQSIPKELS